MSSGPVGLDVREYVYAYHVETFADAVTHTLDAHSDWLVTKVQLFAAAAGASIALGASSAINLAANGCLTLEPNGAFKDTIGVRGLGAMLIVEYWFQTIDGQFIASIPVTVTPP